MALNRRDLINHGTLSLAGFACLRLGGSSLAFAAPKASATPLVLIFLRGGCDTLSLVLPASGEDRAIYEAERPNLQIPLNGPKPALPLDGRFAMHPAALPMQQLYQAKRLAIVHAVGLPVGNRSHFDAQNMIELGTPGKRTGSEGWFTRFLAESHRGQEKGTGAVIAVGGMLPTMLWGSRQALVLGNAGGPGLAAKHNQQDFQRLALRQMYEGTGGWLGAYGTAALDAVDRLEGLAPKDYKPDNQADYPKGDIGGKLKTLAELLKMPIGLTAAVVDMGGWDTHKNQGSGPDGHYADLAGQLAQGINALLKDTAGHPLTLVVMSEFGRRLKENANHGTDHGHGGVMLVAGEGVRGGKVYGEFPGLKTDRLYERADLAVTTDYRQVLYEVLGLSASQGVFPAFKPGKSLGLMS